MANYEDDPFASLAALQQRGDALGSSIGLQGLMTPSSHIGIDFMAGARGAQMARDVNWQERLRKQEAERMGMQSDMWQDRREQRERNRESQRWAAEFSKARQQAANQGLPFTDFAERYMDMLHDDPRFLNQDPLMQQKIIGDLASVFAVESADLFKTGHRDEARRLNDLMGRAAPETDIRRAARMGDAETVMGILGQTMGVDLTPDENGMVVIGGQKVPMTSVMAKIAETPDDASALLGLPENQRRQDILDRQAQEVKAQQEAILKRLYPEAQAAAPAPAAGAAPGGVPGWVSRVLEGLGASQTPAGVEPSVTEGDLGFVGPPTITQDSLGFVGPPSSLAGSPEPVAPPTVQAKTPTETLAEQIRNNPEVVTGILDKYTSGFGEVEALTQAASDPGIAEAEKEAVQMSMDHLKNLTPAEITRLGEDEYSSAVKELQKVLKRIDRGLESAEEFTMSMPSPEVSEALKVVSGPISAERFYEMDPAKADEVLREVKENYSKYFSSHLRRQLASTSSGRDSEIYNTMESHRNLMQLLTKAKSKHKKEPKPDGRTLRLIEGLRR